MNNTAQESGPPPSKKVKFDTGPMKFGSPFETKTTYPIFSSGIDASKSRDPEISVAGQNFHIWGRFPNALNPPVEVVHKVAELAALLSEVVNISQHN